jgi:hypothetical protein
MSSSTPVPGEAERLACRAAECWPPARLLQQRAATVREATPGHHLHAGSTPSQAKASFLLHQAAWQRDLAAASALRAYYSLIAVELQLTQIERGEALLDEQSRTQAALAERGLGNPDPTALERRRLTLADQRLVLEKNRQHLQNSLVQLTHTPDCQPPWTHAALAIQPRPLDCDQLVRTALCQRHDLLAWQTLARQLNSGNAQAVAEMVSTLAGGVQATPIDPSLTERWWLKLHGDKLLQRVVRELRTVRDMHQRLVSRGVCERCATLATEYQRVQLAEQLRDSWLNRVAALERLEELGDARPEELGESRAEAIQAEATLIQRLLDARTAEIDLAEALGGLAARVCRGEPWFPIAD